MADRVTLLAEITCPNCWQRFSPQQTLFVARHDSLIGDQIAGQTAYQRFLPSRFTVTGDALDARGMACQQLACPRCHLVVARPMIEMPALFVSMAGEMGSGKSYFLASMIWTLRQQAARLGFAMADADPAANVELQGYEQLLFMNPHRDTPIAIRKTQTTDPDLHQTVLIEGQSLTFPRPFVFTIRPRDTSKVPASMARSLVLYDNAGESFRPGADTTNSPVTLHLAESEVILFIFDPTQDPRMAQRVAPVRGRTAGVSTVARQELLLNEMASRVRRYRGLRHTARHDRPVIIVLAKADVWLEPELLNQDPVEPDCMLDMPLVKQVSDHCRGILERACPEIVSSAEDFAQQVLYIPVSSLGTQPELVQQADGTRFTGIRPSEIQPKWVSVPLLWTLMRHFSLAKK